MGFTTNCNMRLSFVIYNNYLLEATPSEEPVFQLYTIINNPNFITVANPETQDNEYEEADDLNQVVYVELPQEAAEDEEEEEEEENSIDTPSTSAVEEDPLQTNQQFINVKLITLSNGQMYLTTDDAVGKALIF